MFKIMKWLGFFIGGFRSFIGKEVTNPPKTSPMFFSFLCLNLTVGWDLDLEIGASPYTEMSSTTRKAGTSIFPPSSTRLPPPWMFRKHCCRSFAVEREMSNVAIKCLLFQVKESSVYNFLSRYKALRPL